MGNITVTINHRIAAEANQLTVDGGDGQRGDVMHGQTVFQAMHAAGVLGHIAADGAGDLRRRVGRVEQTMRARRFGDA